MGYSLPPVTQPNLYSAIGIENCCNSVFGDILDKDKLAEAMLSFSPDIVFHLAAQPLVRLSYKEPFLTYQTNIIGTLNVLEAARNCASVKALVNITTDKCYENIETNHGYKEDDPLGGYDMYSSSKACVEIMSSSYRRSFLNNGQPYALATARAGNVIGGGDWAEDRLIPDCVRAIQNKEKILIRNPQAVRPWQHVLEPLFGYLLLGKKLLIEGEKYAQAFNFGPNKDSVLKVTDIVEAFINAYGRGQMVIDKTNGPHEANLLLLDIEKAEKILGWAPQYSALEAIEKTSAWYKHFYNGDDMAAFTLAQIKEFEGKHACKQH